MDCAFVTGGTGFLGAAMVRVLLEKGLKVRALARKGSDLRNLEGLKRVEIVSGDLLDKTALRDGTTGCRYAFHLAADYRIWVTDADPMYRANVDGTENVIKAAARSGVERIVHCSSVAAVRPPHGRTVSDETAEYPGVDEVVGDYKKSKYLSDLLARRLAKEGLPVVIANPAAPIGPRDIKPTPTGRVVTDFMNGRMPSYIDTGMNIVHVDDCAEGHWLAATKGRVGERYILGGENLTLKQVLDLLAQATGLPAPRFKTPYAVAYAFGAVDTFVSRLRGVEPRAPRDAIRMAKHYMWYSSAKAEKELGYTHRPALAALKDAAEWFAANGYAAAPAP
jgi:dihydroflavonol-4-reductase